MRGPLWTLLTYSMRLMVVDCLLAKASKISNFSSKYLAFYEKQWCFFTIDFKQMFEVVNILIKKTSYKTTWGSLQKAWACKHVTSCPTIDYIWLSQQSSLLTRVTFWTFSLIGWFDIFHDLYLDHQIAYWKARLRLCAFIFEKTRTMNLCSMEKACLIAKDLGKSSQLFSEDLSE